MMLVPTQTAESFPPLTEPAGESVIPGLDVRKPEPAPGALRFQAAADVLRDLQIWKADTAAWQEEYVKTHAGPDARNAAEEARAFNEEQYRPLREKYANDPVCSRYLNTEGSAIGNRSLGYMHAYAQAENERFVDSVLAREEQELRELVTSPWPSPQDRQQAFEVYAFKAENWRLERGWSPEAIRTWKEDLARDLTGAALRANFDRLLEHDPDQALTLVRLAGGGKSGAGGLVEEGEGSERNGGVRPAGVAPGGASAGSSGLQTGERPDGQAGEPAQSDQLRKMSLEYARFMTEPQLQLMWNRAAAEKRRRAGLAEERVAALLVEADDLLLRAVDGGDLASLQSVAEDLAELGKTGEAQRLITLRESMAQLQPYLEASRFEPFARQRSGLGEVCAAPRLPFGAQSGQAAQYGAAARQARSIAEQGLAEREKRFRRDPAGYVAEHPLLGRAGLSAAEFCQQEGISQEELITRSLRLQARLGEGLDANPRVLTAARAAEIKEQYDSLADPQKQAELLRQLATEAGCYSGRLLAEAGLPPAISIFAQVLPELPQSEAARLTQAAGSALDDLDISEARKEEARRQVAESPLAHSLRLVGRAVSGQEEPDAVAGEILRSLESFVALGGNLPDLERRVELANAELGGQRDPGDPDRPQRTFWGQQAHGLGVGTRGVVDGAAGAADLIAAPSRFLLNFINGLFGGDPDYFKPIGSGASDALDLPRPENAREEIFYSINKGGAGAIFLAASAGGVLAIKEAASATNGVLTFVQALRANPGAGAVSGAGAELGLLAAQKGGLGPGGTMLMEMTASLVGGKVAPGGAGARAGSASKAVQAEARGVKAAEEVAGNVKPRGRDFTDFRTDAEMQALHQQIKSIKPKPEDFLYAPPKSIAASSRYQAEKLSQNLKKDLGVTATPIETSPGQWKLRVDYVPPPPSLPEARKLLEDMYDAMQRKEQCRISLGVIGPEEAARIKTRTKVDALLHQRTLDTEWIGHAFKRHGEELAQGQASITKQDFVRYGEILLDPHWIERGAFPGGVVFSRRYPDGTVYAIEQQKRGKNMEFRTLWKQVAGGAVVIILSADLASDKES